MTSPRDRRLGCTVALPLALLLWACLAGVMLLALYLAYRIL